MRSMLLMTAVALGAPSAWAQDVVLPDGGDGYSVEEPLETSEAENEGGQDAGGYDHEADDADDDGDDSDRVGEDADRPAKTEREDQRSARGSDRGGQRGSVSIMARSGLGPVFGALRSQGYGGFEIAETDGEIRLTASRGGELRDMTYDASTGKILSDVSVTGDGRVTETVANRFGKADSKTKRGRDAAAARRGYGKSKAGESGHGASKGRGASANASSRKGGDGSGKGAGGGKSGKSSGGGSKGGGMSSGGKGGGKSGGKGNGKSK